ncbi:hypothetical protein ON010_g13873 [Phytophthora cinnamomi]|nr:hypothetical protein ON010_g13873 [Phytophthora cinnamomi]
MTRRLHEFKMEEGSTMAKHPDKFGELIVGLQTLGEPLDDGRQLVILLSSPPAEYELITPIVKNSKDVTRIKGQGEVARGVRATGEEGDLGACAEGYLVRR